MLRRAFLAYVNSVFVLDTSAKLSRNAFVVKSNEEFISFISSLSFKISLLIVTGKHMLKKPYVTYQLSPKN